VLQTRDEHNIVTDGPADKDPPRAVRSVWWQTKFANRKAWLHSSWSSFWRNISKSFSLRNWSSSSFLPRGPSEFKQASRKTFARFALIGRAYSAMKRITVFKTALARATPVEREESVERRRWVNSKRDWVGRFSRVPIPSRADCFGGMGAVSCVLGTGLLGFYHRRLRISGLTWTANVGILPI
jgi:hypothetical protein